MIKYLIKYLLLPFFLFLQMLFSMPPDRNVIIVIIDGARYSETLGDTAARFIPRMKQLSVPGTGIAIDTFLNDGVTVTKRAIPAIWSGSWAVPVDTVINGISTQYTTVPSVWEYYRKKYNAPQNDAVYFIKYLTSPWLQSFNPEYGMNYWPKYIVQGTSDLDVWNVARSYMELYHPHLAVIYLADVDHYGHSGVWDDYTKAIRTADSIVGMIFDFTQNDSVYNTKTDIIVTNDHGRHLDGVSSGFTGHGDNCLGCRRIMLLATGWDFTKVGTLKTKYTIPDIVPTVGKILGFQTPYCSGQVMNILLMIDDVDEKTLQGGYDLSQNYPNPFNSKTRINYELKIANYAKVMIYDMLGREIEALVNREQPSGKYSVEWNADKYSSGIYFFELRAGSFREIKKMMLVK